MSRTLTSEKEFPPCSDKKRQVSVVLFDYL